MPEFTDFHDDQVLNPVDGNNSMDASTVLMGSDHSLLSDSGLYLSQDFLLQRILSLRMDRPYLLGPICPQL